MVEFEDIHLWQLRNDILPVALMHTAYIGWCNHHDYSWKSGLSVYYDDIMLHDNA